MPADDGEAPANAAGNMAADLADLIARTHVEDAARARSRERTLRAAAAADATLAGILLDVAEAGEPVTVRTALGRTLTGTVVLVAADCVVLDTGAGPRCYVRTAMIATVRRANPPRASGDSAGDRPPPRATTFAALAGELAAERPRVALSVAGEQALLTGELRAAATDVLTVRLDGDPPVTAHVAFAQLSELLVLASG